MTPSEIVAPQRTAATVVGIVSLLAIPLSVFPEFYVSSRQIVPNDAAATASHVLAHETLFRLGVAGNLTVFALNAVLATALYVVLRPVDRSLALPGFAWRLVETAVLLSITLGDLDALRVLSGADYLRVFEADRLAVLARLSIGAHGAAQSIGLLFTGLGSTVFCSLWRKSRHVPRPLAAAGVFASLLLGSCSFAFIIFPGSARSGRSRSMAGRFSSSRSRWVSGSC